MALSLPPLTGMDDPVPGDSCVGICGSGQSSHQIETRIQRWLLLHPGLNFLSLTVRRLPGAICLEGVLQSEEGSPDFEAILSGLPGVKRVINNVRVCRTGDSVVT